MKIILKENNKNLGEKGEIKMVADGYARNFLIPKKLAVQATKKSLEEREVWMKDEKKKEEKFVGQAEDLLKKLEKMDINILSKAKEDGSLFGSVKEQHIADEISKELGKDFKTKFIDLEAPLRKTGDHQVKVKLAPKKEALIKVTIKPEEA
ncbi:50S ribosomal protein L9 [Patescibacteria group bacterium]|nr:50S ribosomal protein L9 [Patescibacteria group bacterium]